MHTGLPSEDTPSKSKSCRPRKKIDRAGVSMFGVYSRLKPARLPTSLATAQRHSHYAQTTPCSLPT
eukprot:193301-Rhodomonas_salina.1